MVAFLVFCLFLFLFSFRLRQEGEIMVAPLGMWWLFVFFNDFSSTFGARSTQSRCFLKDTRPSATFPDVVRSFRRKPWSCRSSESGAWPARARELLALWCAWQPRSAFFWPGTVGLGATVADLRLGGIGDGPCGSSAAVSGGLSPCLYWWQPDFVASVCLCCLFPCFFMYSLFVYYWDFIRILVGSMLDRPSFIWEWA